MPLFSFTIVCHQAEISEEAVDTMYSQGFSDAVISQSNGRVHLVFDREATTYDEAVSSAIANLRESGTGLSIQDIIGIPPLARET